MHLANCPDIPFRGRQQLRGHREPQKLPSVATVLATRYSGVKSVIMFPGVQLLLPKKNHKITTQNVIDYFYFQVSIAAVAMVLISASASALTSIAVRSAAFTARRINHGRLPPRFPHSFFQQHTSSYLTGPLLLFPTQSRTPFKNRKNGRYHAQQMRAAASSSSSALSSSTSISLELTTAEDTEEVGALLSGLLLEEYQSNGNQINGGFTIMLGGDLGAGKTAFSRGFIRAATGNNELRVTSPTYLLVNVYEATVEGEALAEEEKSQPLQEQPQRQIIEYVQTISTTSNAARLCFV